MSLAVIGANSGMAQAVAKRFAVAGHPLLLMARNEQSLANARAAVAPAVADASLACDVLDIDSLAAKAGEIIEWLARPESGYPFVICAVGSIAGQEEAKTDAATALKLIDSNFRNLVALLTPIAEALRSRGQGTLIIVSSVAGDRGRQSNYVYGAAKAGLSVYAQGLRNRLASHGVHVLTVKPGYVDTPMLRSALGDGYGKTPRVLIGQPEKIAEQIYRAALAKKDMIYVAPLWRWIMLVVRAIPEKIFKRMRM